MTASTTGAALNFANRKNPLGSFCVAYLFRDGTSYIIHLFCFGKKCRKVFRILFFGLFRNKKPEDFGATYPILCHADGTLPGGETDAPLYYRWSDCPVLTGLELGEFEIPVVGGMFADTVDTLVGSSLLIQNAVGALGLLLLLGRLMIPLLRTVAAMLLYRAVAAVLEPMTDSPLCSCISQYSEVFSLLFIIQLSVGAMFLLLVAQLVMVGHFTVMLR